MPRRITEKTFYHYIKCPNWVFFRANGKTGSEPHDPLLDRLVDDGMLPEYERLLISDREDVVEVKSEDPDDAFRETLEFMREGRETIYNATLIHGHWVGSPNILAKVEGRSDLGDYYYVASDIKRARKMRDEYKLQGCFYAELLSRIQKVKPVQGYVITPDKEILSYLIEEFEVDFKLNLHEIERIIAGDRPSHILTSGCKQSPWFETCRGEAQECNDLSILNRVWREEVVALQKAGYTTIDQLAAASVPELGHKVKDVRPFRLEILHDQAVAITKDMFIIREAVDLPKAKTELYFDIESDPLRDFDYLFGVLEVTDGKETYYSFVAKNPEDEGKAWKEFTHFIEAYIDAPIYHYGWFEREVVDRFVAKYGASEFAIEALERNMIDILYILRPAVVFPLSFYALKDIARYIGFEWRDPEASGLNSILWFEGYLANKRKTSLLKRVIEYNEDDVRATYVLKKWLAKHAR